jgi:hypothetical protein
VGHLHPGPRRRGVGHGGRPGGGARPRDRAPEVEPSGRSRESGGVRGAAGGHRVGDGGDRGRHARLEPGGPTRRGPRPRRGRAGCGREPRRGPRRHRRLGRGPRVVGLGREDRVVVTPRCRRRARARWRSRPTASGWRSGTARAACTWSTCGPVRSRSPTTTGAASHGGGLDRRAPAPVAYEDGSLQVFDPETWARATDWRGDLRTVWAMDLRDGRAAVSGRSEEAWGRALGRRGRAAPRGRADGRRWVRGRGGARRRRMGGGHLLRRHLGFGRAQRAHRSRRRGDDARLRARRAAPPGGDARRLVRGAPPDRRSGAAPAAAAPRRHAGPGPGAGHRPRGVGGGPTRGR